MGLWGDRSGIDFKWAGITPAHLLAYTVASRV